MTLTEQLRADRDRQDRDIAEYHKRRRVAAGTWSIHDERLHQDTLHFKARLAARERVA
jgi:hypothetical protein